MEMTFKADSRRINSVLAFSNMPMAKSMKASSELAIDMELGFTRTKADMLYVKDIGKLINLFFKINE